MTNTKRTNKILSWMLCLAMVISILPMSVFAAEPEVVKSYHVATLYDDGTLEIFADVSNLATIPWQNERASIIKVVFTVDTPLYTRLFSDCTNLAEITLPSTVTEIPLFCFNSCPSLASITIPDSVTSIGDRAFSGCSALESVIFGENSNLQSIGNNAFNQCDALTSITIPDSVMSIDDWAFNSCDTLTSIAIPDSVASIGERAFSDCKKLSSITFGANSQLQTIGIYAFNNCDVLESIVIPDTVTSIGGNAFNSCDTLANIVIPDSVTSINNGAFSSCKALASIAIPDSVTSIDERTFFGCDALTSVTIPDSVTSIGESAFYDCDSLASIIIPNLVASIGELAFYGCDVLANVTIPDSVTFIGEKAFDNCDVLTEIDYEGSVENWNSITKGADAIPNSVKINHTGSCVDDDTNHICDLCGEAMVHSYTYTASDNVITESCICGHSETATITAPENPVYDGTAKEATVAYSDNWKGGTLTIAYSEGGNVSAGSVTASIGKDGATASVVYEIAKATPIAIDGSVTKAASIRKNNKLSASTITGGKYKGIGDVELEGTYEWKEPDKDMTADSKEIVVFTPNNTNYTLVEIEVDVDVTSSSSSGGGGVSRYTIKFDTDGGTAIANKTVTRNSKLAEPEAPTKDGYSFIGWFTDEELTTAYDFDSKVTKGFTLYAKWEKHDDEKPVDEKPVTPEWENPFTDVKADDWYYEDVEYAVENGLFNGTTETTFAPNGIITRAMMVTVLYRAEGEPATNRSIPFADVDMGAYYANAVIWAKQNDIVKGVSETEFAPNDNITREQIAAIMHRYAQYKGYDVSVGENTNILSYDDFDSISEYAIASMQYAVGSGLMKGKTETTLNPLDFATRAEIAAILHRFVEANK